ncbi:potassium channel family protein [Aequorivita marina]|uniref:potassium channel family protein n=1 Tax=Aequorivita marina TaxID=3073654 RepID=UPI002874F3F7|nr:potassium channel family protein [Aequorivita sp. S2608]MDS1297988.1 potassium channel family protein [Aequorivita sp. S2608]
MIFFKTIYSFLKNKEYRSLIITTSLVIGFGTVAYHYLESWSWLDSLYFSLITLTTIGYGDFSPQTEAGKWFTIFYIIIGVGIILTFVNTVYQHFSPNKNDDEEVK